MFCQDNYVVQARLTFGFGWVKYFEFTLNPSFTKHCCFQHGYCMLLWCVVNIAQPAGSVVCKLWSEDNKIENTLQGKKTPI